MRATWQIGWTEFSRSEHSTSFASAIPVIRKLVEGQQVCRLCRSRHCGRTGAISHAETAPEGVGFGLSLRKISETIEAVTLEAGTGGTLVSRED